MGNFYTSHTVFTGDPNAVADVLQNADKVAIVAPAGDDFTVVFDRDSDDQDIDAICSVGTRLSLALGTKVLATLNHDDDMFWFCLFESGRTVGEYNSCPAFGDDSSYEASNRKEIDAETLCAKLGCTDKTDRVATILEAPAGGESYQFEVDRHLDFAKAIGLPDVAGSGYRYVSQGELPEFVHESELIRVGE